MTESESLEQDGVLVVNISTDNVLNLDELYTNIKMSNNSPKAEEVKNKIQSNSREITGDSNNNNNIKFKLPENATIAPAPTNGELSLNGQEYNNQNISRADITKYKLSPEINETNDLLKPTESLQTLIDESSERKRHRRRRHGNSRR